MTAVKNTEAKPTYSEKNRNVYTVDAVLSNLHLEGILVELDEVRTEIKSRSEGEGKMVQIAKRKAFERLFCKFR